MMFKNRKGCSKTVKGRSKTGKGRSKTGKGRSKTGKDVQNQEKLFKKVCKSAKKISDFVPGQEVLSPMAFLFHPFLLLEKVKSLIR
jgi:hypothetical protein